MDSPDDAIDPASLAPEQQLAADEVAVPAAATHAGTHAAPLVQGSLWKAIWTMSWPLMLTTIATSIVGLVDVQVAGVLGSTAQAAVGLAEQVIFVFMVFLMSIGVGTTALVSRAYGEKRRDDADFAAGQSLVLSVLMGLVLTGLALGTAHFLIPLFTKAPDVTSLGDLYLSVYSLYIVPFSLVCITNAAFRAIGDARINLLIVLTEVIINIIGDYAFVLGNWPVPGLGVRGLAWAAFVGSIAAAAMALFCISRSPIRHSLTKIWPLSFDLIKRILNVGLPAALQRITWAISVFVVFFILAKLPQPTPALAAWTIGMRVEAILFMPLMALSLAVGSIVGQNLGAGQVERAFKAGWHVTSIGVALMVVLAVSLFVFAQPCARLMTHDPKTIEFTADYLRINALAEPLLAVNMILAGALQGAGDTRITMWVSIITNWFVRLPIAWILSLNLNWGPTGVWAAMSFSVSVAALIIAARFQSRAWAHIKV